MMLEKSEDDQLNRPCEEWGSITQSQRGQKYPTQNTKKEELLDWSHLAQELSFNTLLKERYKDRYKWREDKEEDVSSY
jgi:hypothetical protein